MTASRRRLQLESLEAREVPAAIAALDPSFGSGGKVFATGAPITDIALQADGKIVAVGTQGGDFVVQRYNPDGTLDNSFNSGGVRTIDFGGTDHAEAVAIQADGKIVVVGSTSNGDNIAVARLTAAGALDTSFDTDGLKTIDFTGAGESGNAVVIQSDGKIVIAGTTGSNFAFVRLNAADGSFDTTFNGTGKQTADLGGTDIAYSVALQSNGAIVAAGTISNSDFGVVRLTSAGALDNSFDSDGRVGINMGGADIARSIVIQPDGKLLVAGSNGADMAVARLLTNGSLDPSFNGTGKQTVDITGPDDARAMVLQSDGRILLIGDTGNNASDTAVVRLTSSGALDTTFNGTGKYSFDVSGASYLDLGTAAVLTPQGRLIIGGQGGGSQVNGSLVRVPVELDKDSPLSVGGKTNGSVTIYKPNLTTGQYDSSAPITVSPFGSVTANARTAVGDVNGDGYPDTVMVTGPGTPIRVAVVSGKDNFTLLIDPFDPFGGNFTGGGFVTTADFDNDGRSEFVITPDQGGGPRVSIFSLAADGSVKSKANFFGIDDPNFRGGARTAAGDVNADGYADLAVAAGFQGGPRVALFDGHTLFGGRSKLVGDFFAFEPALRNGTFVAIGDMNGDGYADLYFGAGPGGAPRVLGISGQALITAGSVAAINNPVTNFFLAGNASNRGGVRLAMTDADGDGRADLVAGTGESQSSFVRVYYGKTFTSAAEPGGFQDLDPFSGATFANGIYVG
jgi:uncharacterized delta-60 repeat protein